MNQAIEKYINELNSYDQSKTNDQTKPSDKNLGIFHKRLKHKVHVKIFFKSISEAEKPDMLISKHGILLKKHQYEQLRLIVKILIYYRDFANQIIEKKLSQDSFDWMVKLKYYFSKNEKEDNLKINVTITQIYFLNL